MFRLCIVIASMSAVLCSFRFCQKKKEIKRNIRQKFSNIVYIFFPFNLFHLIELKSGKQNRNFLFCANRWWSSPIYISHVARIHVSTIGKRISWISFFLFFSFYLFKSKIRNCTKLRGTVYSDDVKGER